MSGEYFRTFIGLPVTVDSCFMDARDRIMTGLKGERISWVNPRNFHVTLRFMGDTALAAVKEISKALSETDLPHSLPGDISGPEIFGPQERPRVIWAGFAQEEGYRKIKEDVDSILDKLGYPPPGASFNPHLTIGRIRALKNMANFRRVLSDSNNVIKGRAETDTLVFYRSTLGPGGPEYSRLGNWKFQE